MSRFQVARGLTLVELVVVTALIGALCCVLLPAVQSAREAGRQLQCKNNLKQIALALHSYEGTWNVFPPSPLVWSAGQRRHRLGGAVVSMHSLILPWIDSARHVYGGYSGV